MIGAGGVAWNIDEDSGTWQVIKANAPLYELSNWNIWRHPEVPAFYFFELLVINGITHDCSFEVSN